MKEVNILVITYLDSTQHPQIHLEIIEDRDDAMTNVREFESRTTHVSGSVNWKTFSKGIDPEELSDFTRDYEVTVYITIEKSRSFEVRARSEEEAKEKGEEMAEMFQNWDDVDEDDLTIEYSKTDVDCLED